MEPSGRSELYTGSSYRFPAKMLEIFADIDNSVYKCPIRGARTFCIDIGLLTEVELYTKYHRPNIFEDGTSRWTRWKVWAVNIVADDGESFEKVERTVGLERHDCKCCR